MLSIKLNLIYKKGEYLMTAVTQRVNINEILMKDQITEEEAILIAKELERLNSVVNQLKDKLKGYVTEHGSVKTDDNEWNIFPYERFAFDSKAILNLTEYLQYLGKDPFDYLSVNNRELKKLNLKERELIQLGGEKKVTNRFDKRKINK